MPTQPAVPHGVRRSPDGRVRPALLAGLVITAVLAVAPLLDLATVDTIGNHVRDAYPTWSSTFIDKDRTAIAVYLAVSGALGIVAWTVALLSLRRPPARAARTITAMFSLGVLSLLVDVAFVGGRYSQVVPPQYTLLALVPLAVGTRAWLLARRSKAHR